MDRPQRTRSCVAYVGSAGRHVRQATPSADRGAPLPGRPLSRERGERSPHVLEGTLIVDRRSQYLAVLVALFAIALLIGGLLALLSLAGGALIAFAHDRLMS